MNYDKAEQKVKKTITSCENLEQIKTAKRLVENFSKKFNNLPSHDSSMNMFNFLIEETSKTFK